MAPPASPTNGTKDNWHHTVWLLGVPSLAPADSIHSGMLIAPGCLMTPASGRLGDCPPRSRSCDGRCNRAVRKVAPSPPRGSVTA